MRRRRRRTAGGWVHAGRAGKTVLIVEDEEPLRRVLRDLLERDGFHVLEASNGVQALDQIDRGAPDVVVLDLNLPQLDGFGVLSRLRSRPSTAVRPSRLRSCCSPRLCA